MIYQIIIKGSADLDTDIIETYLTDNSISPEVILSPITNQIAKDLPEFPYMYPVCKYDKRYRKMPVNSYLVLYHVDEEKHRVEIHHIWHGMRNIKRLLEDDRTSST